MSDAEMSDDELLSQARRDYAAALAEHERNPQPVLDGLEHFVGKVADLAQRVRDRAARDPIAQIDLCRIADKTEMDADAKLEALGVSPAARLHLTNFAQVGRVLLGLPPSQGFLRSLLTALDYSESPPRADRVVDDLRSESEVCPWCAGPIITTGPLAPRECEGDSASGRPCPGVYLWCADVHCEWRGLCSTVAVAHSGRDDNNPEEVARCRGECGGTLLRRAAAGWSCECCHRLSERGRHDA